MLPISILRKAYYRMFDEYVQERFTSIDGFLDNGNPTVSVNYEKVWVMCIFEVCLEYLIEDLKIVFNKREEKMMKIVFNKREEKMMKLRNLMNS